MAFFRLNYFYKVVILITFSVTVYLITNQYLVDVSSVPFVEPRDSGSGRVSEADQSRVIRTKYSVVVSSSSSSTKTKSQGRPIEESKNNEFSEKVHSGNRNALEGTGKESNKAKQDPDWFQSFKVST
jgi:hypothetical protein